MESSSSPLIVGELRALLCEQAKDIVWTFTMGIAKKEIFTAEDAEERRGYTGIESGEQV